MGDIEVEKEKYGALYASIKRKLQSACKRHEAELNRYDDMPTDKRVFWWCYMDNILRAQEWRSQALSIY